MADTPAQETVDTIAALTTEGRNPASTGLDQLDAAGIARLMNSQDASIAGQVAGQIPAIARLMDAMVDRLRKGGRVFFTGAGTSGRLGVLDAAECVPTFQSPPGQISGLIAGGMGAMFRAVEGAEDSPDLASADLRALGLDSRDCVIGIAASGRTPYVLGSLREAGQTGALTGAIACVPGSRIGQLAEHVIEVVTGPEVLMGSTRLRAATATKLVLNTLTTGAMILLGKTMGDLMVDLRASNEKLRLRSIRIVAMATGTDSATAASALARSGGEVKTAIVCLKRDIPPPTARACLRAAGGRVSEALRAAPDATPTVAPGAVAGIDGGGTSLKVRLAVRDGGGWRDLPLSLGPPALPATHAPDGVAFEWRRRLLGLLADAGLPPDSLGAIVAGTSGAGDDRVRVDLADQLARWFPTARVQIVTDIQLLARAAGDPNALCLIAGTGSIAWWEPHPGVVHRAGGYGPGVGDEGGGLWLSEEAIRAVCMAEDGRGPDTTLRDALLAETGQADGRGLAAWHQRAGRGAARLAAILLRQATAGDMVAQSLRAKAIYHLRALVQTVLRKDFGSPPKTLVAGGGLFNDEDFWQAFTQSFHTGGQDLPVWTRLPQPVDGALQSARDLLEKQSRTTA